ncbi:type III secretion system chaperone [Pseudomonas sp. IT-P253]|uniref:InvB/SpaK family type III secretion system chaperone n=1 Tax=Pseudomonas sp. IT-P253 TaxID=3026455 RepID=UPI0039E05542
MRQMDIARLLREALLHSGCTGAQLGHFDSHSTIEMHMRDVPNVCVGDVDGEVWVWASITEARPRAFDHCAVDLWQFLLQGSPWSRSGQLHLCEVQGQLELRLMCNEQALCDAPHFAQALDAFVAAIEELCGILRL